jgi:hypothetical protein
MDGMENLFLFVFFKSVNCCDCYLILMNARGDKLRGSGW